MNTRAALLSAFAAVHLLLVVCGAAGLSLLPDGTRAGKALRWYGAMSGSDNGYGFFAPGVASQLRARFTLSDGAGRSWGDTLEGEHNPEVTLRIGGIVGLFAEGSLGPGLAASWAAKLFGRHPDARRLVVRVEAYDLPPMAEYRKGDSPRWQPIYEATFCRDPSGSPEQGTKP
jgi:hypothetical protein